MNDREGENVSGVLIICQVLWDSCLPKQHYHNKDTGKSDYYITFSIVADR